MSRTIVVSDLHVDTWTDRKIRNTSRSKKEHFFDLLDWCEKAKVRELVIDGDLMDFPPYSGQFSFPDGPSIARDVIERLIAFNSRVPVTYVFGNHDIGISGFRSGAANSIGPLKNVNFCYPDYVIDDYPESTILFEHGHFCDPVILLYLRDLAKRTYLESEFDEFQWAVQRRKPTEPQESLPPGALTPVAAEPGENAYYAAKQGQRPIVEPTLWERIRKALWRWGSQAVAKPTMEHWWKAALEEMDRYLDRVRAEGRKPKRLLHQIYGHTHRADPRDPVSNGDTMCIYINSGTWTEEVDAGWYLDIDETGKVWLQDWINEPAGLRRL